MSEKLFDKMRLFSIDDSTAMHKWDNFVISHPGGTPYHLSGWLKTIVETYGFKPLLYALQDINGNISSVFPLFKINYLIKGLRILSLPFSDYGGPLLGTHDEGSEFIEALKIHSEEGIRNFEIRGYLPQEVGFIRHAYYKRHLFDLQRKIPEMLKTIDKRTIQYAIRKAEKAGITIKEANNESGMREFIRLNMLTRKKHGVPSQPNKWFEQLLKNIISVGNGFILTAELDHQVIGASIFLRCGHQLHYKYNASDPAIIRSASPNHFLTWTAIKWGNENNFTTLDFGRTAPDNEGLMRYKEMWGVTVADLPYFYYPKIKGASSVQENNLFYRLYTSAWRLLPNFIAEKFSAVVFKYLA